MRLEEGDIIRIRLETVVGAWLLLAAAMAGCPRPGSEPEGPRLSFSVGAELRPDPGRPLYQGRNSASALADLAPFFLERDLVMCDLAGGFEPGCAPGMHWSGNDLSGLLRANLKVLSLADDHSLDCGPDSLGRALAMLLDQGFYLVGAGRTQPEAAAPVFLERNGVTVGIIAFKLEAAPGEETCSDCPGPARYDKNTLNQGLAVMKESSHHQIVVFHFPDRQLPALSEDELAAAREAVDFGADLVIGYGPATAGGLHRLRGKWLIAGMGRMSGPPSTDPAKICDGLVLSAEFSPTAIAGLRLSPVTLDGGSAKFLRGDPGAQALIRLLTSSSSEVQDNSRRISDILYLK